MSTKEADKQNSNFEEEVTKEELLTREEIEGTPFNVIGTENGYFGCIGKYRITEVAESAEEIRKELAEMTWNRITQVILILIEMQTKK